MRILYWLKIYVRSIFAALGISLLAAGSAYGFDIDIADATTPDESAVDQTIAVFISSPQASAVSVDFAITDGTAEDGSDYTASTGTLTFSAGETVKHIPIPILADTLDEEDESVIITLSNPTSGTLVDTQAILTITDDDNPPQLSIADNATSESSGSFSLAATLDAPSSKQITVAWQAVGLTATDGEDFTAASGTLTFAPNSVSENITLTIAGDSLDEEDEIIRISLSNPVNASINSGNALLTILDDDPEPSISIADLTTTDENSATLTLTLSAPSAKTISVQAATNALTAAVGDDFTGLSQTVSFAAGTTQQTLTVSLVNDSLDEINETFEVQLSNALNASISDNLAVVTITDDDSPPALSISQASIIEDNTNLSANVVLSAPSSLSIEVDYATTDGSATNGADYTAASGTLTFAPGQTSQPVLVAITQDSIDEIDESFTITLSNPDNATIATAQADMTITDNDGPPTISISDNSTADESASNASLTVSLSAASERDISVSYVSSDGTATQSSDYSAVSGTLNFASGITVQTIQIPVLADSEDEANETVNITLSNPVNASLNDNMGVLTITDDDSQPTISIADVTTANEVAVSQNITLSLSAASGLPVTVDWATQDGTAVAGGMYNDYRADSGQVIFTPGSTSQTIAIQILDDNIAESNESFAVNLSNASNATISDNSSVVTITDDDSLSIAIDDITIPDESAVIRQFTVTLSNPSANVITVDYATQDNSSQAGSDYTATSGTLSFTAGVTSQTIDIPILDDAVQEGVEGFAVNLSNATGGATIADSQGLATLIDDDGNADISIADITASETAGTVSATVSLSYAMPVAVSVDWQTADNTALAGADYVADNGTLNFTAGVTSQTISITLLGDTEYEGDENFTLSLSNAVNATLTDSQAVITIREDDTPLSASETEELRQNLIFGKNSIARAETQFMNRVLTRNRNMLFAGSGQDTQPKLSFQNLAVDWNDHSQDLDAIFSLDDLSSDGSRNLSWETAISHSKNASGVKNTALSTAINFSHRLSDQMMLGYILGFGYSDTAMSGSMVGSNKGTSASIGLYSSYKIQESLILDLMAAQSFEQNSLDTNMGGKIITGEFDRTSTVFSTSLQGVFKFATAELRPTFTYSAGKSVFSHAYFDISQAGLTSTQQIDFGTDEYYSLSFEPEVKLLIGNPARLIRPSGFNMLKLRPKYFCEKYNSESRENCGRGMGITLANHHPTYYYNQDLTFDYEKIADTKTYSLRYKKIY